LVVLHRRFARWDDGNQERVSRFDQLTINELPE
jgi:hypothetical protein